MSLLASSSKNQSNLFCNLNGTWISRIGDLKNLQTSLFALKTCGGS